MAYADDYEQSINILNGLRSRHREFIRKVVDGLPEKAAFIAAYRAWVGKWDEKPEPFFMLSNEDLQRVAKDVIKRDLTEDEIHQVRKGVETGLDDWSEIAAIAIRGVTGEGDERKP